MKKSIFMAIMMLWVVDLFGQEKCPVGGIDFGWFLLQFIVGGFIYIITLGVLASSPEYVEDAKKILTVLKKITPYAIAIFLVYSWNFWRIDFALEIVVALLVVNRAPKLKEIFLKKQEKGKH